MARKKQEEPAIQALITIEIYPERMGTKIDGFENLNQVKLEKAFELVRREYSGLKQNAVLEARMSRQELAEEKVDG